LHGLEARQGLKSRAVPSLSEWTHVEKQAKRCSADLVISALFPEKIPARMLEIFEGRIVNLHPSLLPAYRGATPLVSMLWDREIARFGGVTLHKVEEGFDTGAILGQEKVEYPKDGNLTAYYTQLITAGSGLLEQKIPDFLSGAIETVPQSETNSRPSRLRSEVFEISENDNLDDTVWRIQHVTDLVPVRLANLDRKIYVKSIEAVLSDAKGRPPEIVDAHVIFDLKDKRVKFKIGRLP